MTQTAPAPAPAADPGSLRFLLTLGAWFVGLFGLMRLGWVADNLLTPFAQIQQRVADQLTGAHTDLLYFDASCSGGDPMALCAGAILAYPAAWGSRFRAAALGLLAITLLNVVRIGHLSLVAADPGLFEALHIYVWPGVLILATAAYVFAWMNREGRAAPTGAGSGRIALSGPARRFAVLSVVLVVVYFATAPFFYESVFVDVVARWIAATGGAILAAAGTAVMVSGPVIRTAHGGFLVTQECIFTPLIPLYIAGALSVPLAPWRRVAALAATPVLFFAVGVSRLLVLAVPATVIGSYSTAIHAFSQVLVAFILVAAAAVYTAGPGAGVRAAAAPRARRDGRRHRRGLRRRAGLGPPLRRGGGGPAVAGGSCRPRASSTHRGPGVWFPPSSSGCSRACGRRWRAARGGAAPPWGWPRWPSPRPCSRFRSASSRTTTVSTRTRASSAGGPWPLRSARSGSCAVRRRPRKRFRPRCPRRRRASTPADCDGGPVSDAGEQPARLASLLRQPARTGRPARTASRSRRRSCTGSVRPAFACSSTAVASPRCRTSAAPSSIETGRGPLRRTTNGGRGGRRSFQRISTKTGLE